MEIPGFCKTEIKFMDMEGLQSALVKLDFQRVALVMSESASKRFAWDQQIEAMQAQYKLLWLGENVSYPTQETLLRGLQTLRGFEPEVIIAIGGGSTIDFAKALKALYHDGVDLETISQNISQKTYRVAGDMLLLAVPTTAGTGAELTQWATVWDYKGEQKYSLDHPMLKPDMAWFVPDFLAFVDKALMIATGLDALSHSVEAYWSRQTNPLVRQLSRQAVSLMTEALPLLVLDEEHKKSREQQCLASLLAALAFSMTRTTASHSISYPLTMHAQIPHGIAVAMTLAQVSEANRGSYPEEKELLELFDPWGGLGGFITRICGDRVSVRLRDYGVEKSQIQELAKQSFTLGRMDNNPALLSQSQVVEMLQRIW